MISSFPKEKHYHITHESNHGQSKSQSQSRSQSRLNSTARRMISALAALVAVGTFFSFLDFKTGYPFQKNLPVPADLHQFLTDSLPILLDDALMYWEMKIEGAHLDSNLQICPQQPPLVPSSDQLKIQLPSEDVLAERLSQAIQVDTSVGDNWPSPADAPDLWAPVFDPFKLYLEKTFPKCHQSDGPIFKEIVNEHGLLYTFKGSDDSLKPLLLMAHQDVVPVNPAVESEWWQPPFSGFISKENSTVWGRGSVDAKSWLVSIMTTLESMVESGYQPKRSIIASWGFDEEAGGVHGAKSLAQRLEEIYGKDSLAMIVDEGNPLLSKSNPAGFGIPVALPAVEEKGMLNVLIRVESQGGHSSAPPPHTSIGLLSKLIVQLENNPDQPFIDLDSAQLKFLQCVRNAPAIDPKLKGALRDLDWATRSSTRSRSRISSLLSDERRRKQRIERAKKRVVDFLGPELSIPFLTTRSVDIFHSGVKSNAIPEQAEAVINHRIATHSSISKLKKEYIRELQFLSKELNLQLFAFGEEIEEYPIYLSNSKIYDNQVKPTHHLNPKNQIRVRNVPFIGKVFIEEWSEGLEPSPKTPISNDENDSNSKAWRLFSGVIRNVWRIDENGEAFDENQKFEGQGEGVLVAPSLMQGNTDTQRYWNFTRNIFRFGPSSLKKDLTGLGAFKGVHTTNEHAIIDGLTQAVKFYTQLIQVLDDDSDL